MEREWEMVNPEQSWSGMIIKCSQRGGEIVAASHTLVDISYVLCFE